MEGKYPVLDGNDVIGWATVSRQGLYYCIQCQCGVIRKEVCKLQAIMEGQVQHMGVLIPVGEKLCLDTKIAVKKLNQKIIRFEVACENGAQADSFIPVSSEKPFPYLTCLKEARFQRRGDEIGIVISMPLRE